MSSCDAMDLVSYLEGEDPEGKISEHLAHCSRCRRELEILGKLLDGIVLAAVGDMEQADLPTEPLPPVILEKVSERNKHWLLTRAKRVLNLHPAKNRGDETERLKKLLEKTDDSLPLAAYPDDLTDKDRNRDDE